MEAAEMRPVRYIDTSTRVERNTTCFISGMDILADGRLLVSDELNMSVKLYNMDDTLAACVPLQSPPYDIAAVRQGVVMVCMPFNKTVHVLSVIADALIPRRVNEFEQPCWSIVACGDDNLVACKGNNIFVQSMVNGHETWIWALPYDEISKMYFQCLSDNTLCVSHGSSVTCLTLDGDVVGKYTDHNQICRNPIRDNPLGITKHRDGSFFVCGSRNILHMSRDCTQIDVLCQGQVRCPQAICYNQRNNTLYVAEKKEKWVKVFQLRD